MANQSSQIITSNLSHFINTELEPSKNNVAVAEWLKRPILFIFKHKSPFVLFLFVLMDAQEK